MTTTPQATEAIPSVLAGPTEFFLDLLVQHDAHAKAWRWHLYRQGITVDRHNRLRSSRTGELLDFTEA